MGWVGCERSDLARRPVPEMDDAGAVAHRQDLAVGRELHRPDLELVLPDRAQTFAGRIPDLDTAVLRLGRPPRPDNGEPVSVGRNGQRRALAVVEVATRQVGYDRGGPLHFQLEDAYRAIGVESDDAIALRAKGDNLPDAGDGEDEFGGFRVKHFD